MFPRITLKCRWELFVVPWKEKRLRKNKNRSCLDIAVEKRRIMRWKSKILRTPTDPRREKKAKPKQLNPVASPYVLNDTWDCSWMWYRLFVHRHFTWKERQREEAEEVLGEISFVTHRSWFAECMDVGMHEWWGQAEEVSQMQLGYDGVIEISFV